MGNKVCETIPFKTFKERIRLVKSLIKKGIVSIEVFDNYLLINYSIMRGDLL